MFEISIFIINNIIWIILIILLLVLIISIIFNLKNNYLKDYLKLKIPVFGKINKWVITSRFTRSLSMMYSSGITLSSALEETIKLLDNLYLKKKLDYVLQNILRVRV